MSKLLGNTFSSFGLTYSSYYRRSPDSQLPQCRWIFKGIGKNEPIGDFGLVRSVEGHDKTAETGSYRHMAPEVIRHEPYGKTCDIYSFSMLMYEMLTLSLPFPHRTPVDVALGVACRAERPPLPPFPDDVLSILTDCWAQNADTRPSFAELAPRVKTLKLKKTSFGSLQMARLTV